MFISSVLLNCLFLQAIALWVNFMGFTDGREPLIIYIIVCWGEYTVFRVGGFVQAHEYFSLCHIMLL